MAFNWPIIFEKVSEAAVVNYTLRRVYQDDRLPWFWQPKRIATNAFQSLECLSTKRGQKGLVIHTGFVFFRRTLSLTGPPLINIDLRNDAIGGYASNALPFGHVQLTSILTVFFEFQNGDILPLPRPITIELDLFRRVTDCLSGAVANAHGG
jgi:hypothetical protein